MVLMLRKQIQYLMLQRLFRQHIVFAKAVICCCDSKHSAQADDLKAYVANAAEAVCEAGISRQEKKAKTMPLMQWRCIWGTSV